MENENKPGEDSGTEERLRIKSVDEVIADMERIASRGECASVAKPVVQNWADLLRTAIDGERNRRLDAVERVCAPGNAAAPREALVWIREYITDQLWAHTHSTILERIETALSAPARNCDRFASIGAAIDGFCREVQDWEDHDGIPDYYELAKWLFAPAEGGAK